MHSYAGYENKVKTNLETRIKSLDMEDYIFQIEVPTEEVTEIKNGQRKQVQRKVHPGYILVRMDLTDGSWGAVRNTPGVTGFVGATAQPVAAVHRRGRQDPRPGDGAAGRRPPAARPPAAAAAPHRGRLRGRRVGHRHGRPVRHAAGHHQRDQRRAQKLKVLVSIFGRETPVELSFTQVAKI